MAAKRRTEFHRDLLSILMDPEMEILMAMSSVVTSEDQKQFVSLLTDIFFAERHELGLVDMCIQREIAEIESITTLFRGSGLPSTLVSSCIKRRGMHYLHTTLQPCLKKICSSKENLELDVNRLDDPTELDANVQRMKRLVKQILDSIFSSVSACPRFIREVCFTLKVALEERFPEADPVPIIATFICLRFFAAAIFDPLQYGVVKRVPTREGRRTLVQITKIVQMIANDTKFGLRSGHEHMSALDEFAASSRVSMLAFVSALFDLPELPKPQQIVDYDLVRTVQPLKKLVPLLQTYFIAVGDTFSDEKEPAQYEKLRHILARNEALEEMEAQEEQQAPRGMLSGIRRSRSMPKMDTDSIPDRLSPQKIAFQKPASPENERGRGRRRERQKEDLLDRVRSKSKERIKLRSRSKERQKLVHSNSQVTMNPVFGKPLSASCTTLSTPNQQRRSKDDSGDYVVRSKSTHTSPVSDGVVKNPVFGLSMTPQTFGKVLKIKEEREERERAKEREEKERTKEVVVQNPLFLRDDPRLPRRDPDCEYPKSRHMSWGHEVVSRFTTNPMRSTSATHSYNPTLARLRKQNVSELLEVVDALQQENAQLQRSVKRLEKKAKKKKKLEAENLALKEEIRLLKAAASTGD